MEPNPLQDQSKDRKIKPLMLTSVKKGFLEGRSIKAIFLKFLTFLTTNKFLQVIPDHTKLV